MTDDGTSKGCGIVQMETIEGVEEVIRLAKDGHFNVMEGESATWKGGMTNVDGAPRRMTIKQQYYGSDYSPAPGARLLMSVISPGAPSARTRVSDIL